MIHGEILLPAGAAVSIEAMHNPERRNNRSPWASVALERQLEQIAERHQLEVLILADQLGHLWAGASADGSASSLAAALPGLKRQPDRLAGLERARYQRQQVSIASLQIDQASLYLAARGRKRALGLREAAPGVTRILSELLET